MVEQKKQNLISDNQTFSNRGPNVIIFEVSCRVVRQDGWFSPIWQGFEPHYEILEQKVLNWYVFNNILAHIKLISAIINSLAW